jgi:hypothetical protein
VFIFFSLIFILGIFIYHDYGISWDEQISRDENGVVNWNFIANHEKNELLKSHEKYHGPAFEILLIAAERLLSPKTMAAIFYLRHLLTFITFYISLIFFFRLTKEIFSSWKLGVVSATLLVLSPRVFAESFYNSKDLVFMCFFIFCMYAAYRLMQEKSYKWAILFGLTSGFLIAIRILGIVMPVVFFVFLFLDLVFENVAKEHRIRYFLVALLFTAVAAGTTILFWPVLWLNPYHYFTEAYNEMKHFGWSYDMLYLGKRINSSQLPWHYLPVWIIITTPILYTLLFFTGIFFLLRNFIIEPKTFYSKNKFLLMYLSFLVFPILAVIFLHSIIYDGWRHLFFVYASFLIISVYGLRQLTVLKKKILFIPAATVTVISFCYVSYQMIKDHPYENNYFNVAARQVFKPLNKYFPMDYWGLSYKEGLEYVLNHDSSHYLKISVENLPGELNTYLLSDEDRERVHIVKSITSSDYYLTNNRDLKNVPGYERKIHEIKTTAGPVLSLYKIDHDPSNQTRIVNLEKTFDDSEHDKDYYLSNTIYSSPPRSLITDSTHTYSYCFIDTFEQNNSAKKYVELKLDGFAPEGYHPQSYIVISFEHNGKTYAWENKPLANDPIERKKWYDLIVTADVPETFPHGGIIKAYLWNISNKPIYVDNMQFAIYQYH